MKVSALFLFLTGSAAAAPSAEELDFYRSQGPLSDPGKNAALLQSLPKEIPKLVEAVQGLLMHGGLCWLYKHSPKEEQIQGFKFHRNTESLLEQMKGLDSQPLDKARIPDKRLIGNCRTFSLLMVSALRSQGVPARMRVGYARYTSGPDKYENHFIFEYWNGRRWVRADAQMDQAQKDLHKLDFDTLDLPKGKFITAGEAWQLAQKGKLDLAQIGTMGPQGWEAMGWKALQIDVLADAWALNKVELITGESNDFCRRPHEQWSKKEIRLFDALARHSASTGANFAALRKMLEKEPELQIDLKAWKP